MNEKATHNHWLLALTILMGLGLLTLLLWVSSPALPAAASDCQPSGNGVVVVSLFEQGRWREVGTLAFDQDISENSLDLPLATDSGSVRVQVAHNGPTAAHLDSILLNGRPPSGIRGQTEPRALALQKLSALNFDLIALTGKTVVFEFPLAPTPSTLNSLTLYARIEPDYITTTPFQFPLENLYQEMSTDSAFYTYVWDSTPGSLTVDGDLADEKLGRPFFKEFSKSGTGHPSAYTYGWVRNDDDTLYVAIDFVGDNTMDGDKDYTKVYVNTPGGLRAFKVSAPEQTWGRPGFVYTPRAVYQHKVYEFAIPLGEMGLDGLTAGDRLPLAFAAYGTDAPPPNDYPGPLDDTFDGDGMVTTSIGPGGQDADAVAVQDDGKIVVAGRLYNGSNNDFALVRYNHDGSLDTTFGTGGVITTDVGYEDWAQGVAIQDDGKIVVVGWANNGGNDDFALARYLSTTGALDPSFGTGGVVTTEIGSSVDSARGVVIQDDGKIVVVGTSSNGGNNDFALARYLSTSGALDTSFGTGGIITTDVGGSEWARGVAIQADGQIVVVGWANNGSNDDFALARYLSTTGALDVSFGTGGIVTTDVGIYDRAWGVAIQEDGKIVVTGESDGDFYVARYISTTGALDTSFGSGGIVTTDFGGSEIAHDVAIQSDGKIVAAGENRDRRFAVARYNADGSLDTSFGTGGRANTLLEGQPGEGHAFALQADGKIVIAGNNVARTAVGVVRYLSSVTPSCFATIDDVTVYSSDGASAVQAAVDAAAPDDVVKVAGTCVGVQTRGGITQTVYVSKSLTIQGGYTATNWLADPDPDTYPTTLDASRGGRVVAVMGNVTATLDSLTITGADYKGLGGGIYNPAAILTIRHTRVISNIVRVVLGDEQHTGRGGGLGTEAGTVYIYDSEFKDNWAEQHGGAIKHYEGQMTIDNSTFSLNTVLHGDGGALDMGWSEDTLVTITNSTFTGNQVGDDGGAIWIGSDASLAVSNSTFSGNEATDKGGAILVSSHATVRVTDSTFDNNVAGNSGGGLYASTDTHVHVTNSTVSGNRVLTSTETMENGGGAIKIVNGGAMTLTNTSIVSNTAPNLSGKDGILVLTGSLTISSSLIAHNGQGLPGAADCRVDGGGIMTSGGYNLSSDTSCTSLTATGDITNTDPLLGPLADNGGDTETHALLPGSPAIEQIPYGENGCGTTITTDQRGMARPHGSSCDIGAYEFLQVAGAVCFVEATGDDITDYSSLDASAIQAGVVLADSGDLLKIAGTCAGVQQAEGISQTVYLDKSITLQGGHSPADWLAAPDPALYPTTLDAEGDGRVVYITGTVDTALEYLVLTGGAAPAGGHGGGIYDSGNSLSLLSTIITGNLTVGIHDNGGGLFSESDALTVMSSSFVNNYAEGYGGGIAFVGSALTISDSLFHDNGSEYNGGGVYLLDTDATVLSSTFTNNYAYDGGGISSRSGDLYVDSSSFRHNELDNELGGGIVFWEDGHLEVHNSTFYSNTATYYGGGGVALYDGTDATTFFTITNSTFEDNRAQDLGGGFLFIDGTGTIDRSIFVGNHSDDKGGAIYAAGLLTITNSIIRDNRAATNGAGIMAGQDGENTIINTTIRGNIAGQDGGGIANEEDLLTVINSTISGNTAAGNGGGIAQNTTYGGSTSLLYTTIVNNSAGNHTDGVHLANSAGQIMTLTSSIIADNGTSNCTVDAGILTDDGYNLDSGNTCGFSQTTSLTNTNPLLGPLANNGGPNLPGGAVMDTHALLINSPALDQIPQGDSGCGLAVDTDQRGVSRPQWTACDIGAFEAETQDLDVTLAGNGDGSVSSDPAGIACPADCSETLAFGTLVTLTANAGSHSTFDGWSGACSNVSGDCNVTMTETRSVTATFALEQHQLSVAVAGEGSGTVSSLPAGITCPGDCGELFDYGQTVTLTASADAGSVLIGWSGACTHTTAVCLVTIDAAQAVTATFEVDTFKVYLPLIVRQYP